MRNELFGDGIIYLISGLQTLLEVDLEPFVHKRFIFGELRGDGLGVRFRGLSRGHCAKVCDCSGYCSATMSFL